MPAKSFELGTDSSYRGSSYRESTVIGNLGKNNLSFLRT